VWIGLGRMNRGWALVEQGSVTDGVEELRYGLSAYEATGARLWRPYFLGLLARALAKGDRLQEGVAVAAEALAVVRDSGERAYAAELHRVCGELLLARASSDSVLRAEDCFQRALAMAREQRATSWELKVATSLCSLRCDRNDRGDALRLLRETYDRFTEGHQTADLKAARRVLHRFTPPHG
jgi:predicted ATPase